LGTFAPDNREFIVTCFCDRIF